MRIFKGLENIHSVIDKHQAEWLREQGEEPERPERISVEERIRRSFAESAGTGKFSADRFMGGHVHAKAEVKAPEPEPESEPEAQSEPSIEVVKVIPQKEENHSWLYNEVLKAIRDAVGDGKNTKVVAVFVPVVQNGKEFESLPVDETVTIQPEPVEPETEEPQEPEELKPENETEEPEDAEDTEEPEQELQPEREIPEIEIESEPDLTETESLPEPEPLPEEPETEEDIPEYEPETETEASEPELPAMGEEFDLLPEGQSEPDAELAEAFQTIEDNLDESLQVQEEEQEPEPEPEPEIEIEQEEVYDEPEELPVIDEADNPGELEADDFMTVSEGEPLAFSEIEEIELPEPLDDDEVVFDDAVFDEPLAASYNEDEPKEETIIIEENDTEPEEDILKKED